MFDNASPSAGDAPLRRTRSLRVLDAAERGWLPDALVRSALRRCCARHLREERAGGPPVIWQRQQILLDGLRLNPIEGRLGTAAPRERTAWPERILEITLGPRQLASSSYFEKGANSLGEAEDAMLALCAERAQLADGQSILELGSDRGAMTLWMAERYPTASITAVCHDPVQANRLQAHCQSRGLRNVSVQYKSLDRLMLDAAGFDRVISIGSFERLRNFETLMTRIASWLRPGGTLFVHMLCHRDLMYTLDDRELEDWLGRDFCERRLMAAASTLLNFQRDLDLERRWMLPGSHHRDTARAWLGNVDRHRDELIELFAGIHGRDAAPRSLRRHRIHLMAQAEMFGHADGGEWMLGHYRFVKP